MVGEQLGNVAYGWKEDEGFIFCRIPLSRSAENPGDESDPGTCTHRPG